MLREELAELLKLAGTSFKVELVMRLLGLSHARDTMIGSAMVGVLLHSSGSCSFAASAVRAYAWVFLTVSRQSRGAVVEVLS